MKNNKPKEKRNTRKRRLRDEKLQKEHEAKTAHLKVGIEYPDALV